MEIGSEFELSCDFLEQNTENLFSNTPAAYFATGRAAIFAALADIKKQGKVKTAYLPDYCCYSCVEPFLKSGIKVLYYKVAFKEKKVTYEIDYSADFDIFYSISYFGFEISNQDKIVNTLKQKGKIVIEDITHRLLSQNKSNADYFIGSLRKWAPMLSGGILIKNGGKISGGEKKLCDEYLTLRACAMKQKAEYLSGKSKDKNEFLQNFSRANKMLTTDWENRAIDEESIKIIEKTNFKKIAEKRSENAKIIYTANVQFLFDLKECDVPLFVPIVFENKEKRDAVRRILCNNDIYCPVHWPNEIESENEIFDRVLSIVIDQRYDNNDMQRIVGILNGGSLK